MRLGVIFPQTEIGSDPVVVRDFAQAVESLGYDHLVVYDHVLGADASKKDGWGDRYNHTTMFHEPFVLFGYLAGVTRKIELATGVLILGQRQTALVAKQAAEVDVLTGGRLRLGIGVGWNEVEYEALGEDFHNRGRRSVEQIELMRAPMDPGGSQLQRPRPPSHLRWDQPSTGTTAHTDLDWWGIRCGGAPYRPHW